MQTNLSREMGIEKPIFAFSYMPEVVAAVTNAGGMGVLGAVRFTAEELEEALSYIDGQVGNKPYGLDVVMPASSLSDDKAGEMSATELTTVLKGMIPEGHTAFVEGLLADHGVDPLPDSEESAARELLGWTDTTARPQLEVAFKHPIRLLVNALGPPPADVVDEAHSHNIPVAALVGRKDQALKQRERGVDIIVAQGTEAGGHTGEVATMVLVPEVVDAVGDAPVLAAGGIGRGRQIAASLALGAQGVWMGSVWLGTAECNQDPMMREKLFAASSSDTVRSRAYSGKPARQLKTAWTDAWEAAENPKPLGMPLQYMLNATAQERIRRSSNPRAAELLGMPVGQIVGTMNGLRTVAEVIASLTQEFDETVARVRTLTD